MTNSWNLITITSFKKQKTIDENATPKAIKSLLYDPRIDSQRVLNNSKVEEMFDFLSKENPIHALKVLNESEKNFLEMKFRMMLVGSVLSRGVARNFLEGGSKSSKMFGLWNDENGKFRTISSEIPCTLTCLL